MTVANLQTAKLERDEGMQLALDHAEAVVENWGDIARAFLIEFARTHSSFISEDVSDAAHADPDFPQPPTDRAFGPVYRRAAADGYIAQCGTGKSRRRHASICTRWQSLIFGTTKP